jgi:hypothetical protein
VAPIALYPDELVAEIGLTIDPTLIQDATGTLVVLELEAMELPRVNPALSTQYADSDGNGRGTLQAPSSKPFTRRFEMFTIRRHQVSSSSARSSASR